MSAETLMNYEEFKDFVKDNFKKYLPSEYADAEVKLTQVTKNNGIVLDGIIVETPNTNMFPTIYLNDFYTEYKETGALLNVMEKMRDVQLDHAVNESVDISKVTDLENVKDKIIPRLINAEKNQGLLADRPYTQMDDLAVTYHVQLSNVDEVVATVAITDAIAEKMGVDRAQLHEIAMSNLAEVTKPKFVNLAEMLTSTMIPEYDSMTPEEQRQAINEMMPGEQPPLYIITNACKTHGASAIFDEKVMSEASEQLGDFYILPSSLHELILMPIDDNTPPISDLEKLVQEVNETQVAQQDFLSDHVYSYDANTKELYRADMKEAHLEKVAAKEEKASTKETQKKETEKKPSLRAKLADKKAEVEKEKALMPDKEITKEKSVAIS